jgi:DNA topoisomerase I
LDEIAQEMLRPDPEQSAREAGLTYVSDEMPGIRRKRWGKGFTYLDPDGNRITDPEERARLHALAIPPAWTEVWICPDQDGHIQVTARDAKGRKQYRYHPRWREVRDEAKFYRVLAFGHALPALRQHVESDLRKRGLPREKVLATVVRLLETTMIRVGNKEYAQANGSFGLTTLRDRHVEISGAELQFEFRGKSGKKHRVSVKDRRLARIVKECRDVTGYHLFQYLDDDGQRQAVDSGDVNDYLREVTGQDFTAKDFRTWAGTVFACAMLRDCEPCESEAEAKRNIIKAIDAVAEQLGNTRAISRDYYIHPRVIECFTDGTLHDCLAAIEEIDGLHPDECAIMTLLQAATGAA